MLQPQIIEHLQEGLEAYLTDLPEDDFARIWNAMNVAVQRKAWKDEAQEGEATSVRPPQPDEIVLVTPEPVSFFQVPGTDTPEKVLNPMRKIQLVAQRKLEQQLKKQKAEAGQSAAEVNNSEIKPDTKPDAKTETKRAKGPKRPRRENNGPMQDAMKEFFQLGKDAGKPHHQIREEWKKSAQRAAICDKLGEAERKKRKYY